MENNDPINIIYSQMIHGMDAEELDAIHKRAFEAEVDAVTKELTKFADDLAEHFDVFVVAAALARVHNDYDNATVGDDE